MKNLTLVIPVKNETESLPKFLKEVIKIKYKVMLVIDSRDKNLYNSKLYKNKSIQKIIPKKTGYGNALIVGINKVKTKYFCIINADGSMNPVDIKNILSTRLTPRLYFKSDDGVKNSVIMDQLISKARAGDMDEGKGESETDTDLSDS